MKKALEGPTPETEVEGLPENQPWKALEKLYQLSDFLLPVPSAEHRRESASAYVQSFLNPLDAASEQLRCALTSQLSGDSGSTLLATLARWLGAGATHS
jgi:hypothetical protein